MTFGTFTAAVTLAALATLAGCRTTAHPSGEVAALRATMSGVFTSTAQARANTDYFESRLVITPILGAGWGRETWLYLEQGAVASLERPYRQRVVRLRALGQRRFAIDIFRLPGNARRFAGAWTGHPLWVTLKPTSLTLQEGCTIYLAKSDAGSYVGGTKGKGCESHLGDAQYATSEMTIADARIVAWDRGFTLDGVRAWGAERGGYVFDQVFAGTIYAPVPVARRR